MASPLDTARVLQRDLADWAARLGESRRVLEVVGALTLEAADRSIHLDVAQVVIRVERLLGQVESVAAGLQELLAGDYGRVPPLDLTGEAKAVLESRAREIHGAILRVAGRSAIGGFYVVGPAAPQRRG